MYVALLRGINVGGKNKLPMRDLAAMFAAAGCEDVRTYIQSGNVVFRASAEVAAGLAAAIPAQIEATAGFRSPVVLRTGDELRAAYGANPFGDPGADVEALHVMFLADAPSEERVAKLDPQRSPGDSFAVRSREVYLRCPNGLGRTKLTNDYFDRTLATVSTIRGWKTVGKLVEMLGAEPG